MKRSREPPAKPLGATEFAAALNGEDPNAIYRCLRQFAKTVRRERRQALMAVTKDDDGAFDSSGDEDDDDSLVVDESLETDGKMEPEKKLRKDEAWKEDSANYNVPFVGTSVSSTRDVGKVIAGEWPSGLLKAYLTKSPLARELTGDDLIPGIGNIHKKLMKEKKGKLSRAIYAAYLQVLSELVTAAIPMDRLLRDLRDRPQVESAEPSETQSMAYNRFLPHLLKMRLQGIILTINAESVKGKAANDKSGSLLPIIIDFLKYISMTGLEASRQVARAIQTLIPERAARSLVRAPTKTKVDEKSDRPTSTKAPMQTKVFQLAHALLVWEDSFVFSCVASHGVRDRKVAPGLVYLLLQNISLDGLTSPKSRRCSLLCKSIASFLNLLNQLLKSGKPSKRMIGDLVSRECLLNISRLTVHAPALPSDASFQSVVAASGNVESSNDLELVGAEARRTLYIMIGDTQRSPLLSSPQPSRQAENVQLLVRAMVMLSNSQKGLATQNLIIHATNATPSLYVGLFHSLPFAETTVFECIRHIHLMSQLVRLGPPIAVCIDSGRGALNDSLEPPQIPILPNCFRKQQINRSLNHKNTLVVAETLKLLILTVQRVEAFLKSERSGENTLIAVKDLLNQLPDPHMYSSLFNRFAYTESAASATIIGYVCKLIHACHLVDPESHSLLSMEWLKGSFSEARTTIPTAMLLAQMSILSLLGAKLNTPRDSPFASVETLHTVLTLLVTTQSTAIYDRATQIAKQILYFLSAPAFNLSPGCRADIEFELSCWMDGMKNEYIDEFCNLANYNSQCRLECAQTWKGAALAGATSEPAISSLIIGAVKRTNNLQNQFSLFSYQVIARCFLNHLNPLPIAAVVAGQTQQAESKELATLQDYANCLLSFRLDDDKERFNCFQAMANTLRISDWSCCWVRAGRSSQLPYGRYKFLMKDVRFYLRQLLHYKLCQFMATSDKSTDDAKFLCPIFLKFAKQSSEIKSIMDELHPDSSIAELLIRTRANTFADVWRGMIGMVENRELLLNMHALEHYVPTSSIGDWTARLLQAYSTEKRQESWFALWKFITSEYLTRFLDRADLVFESCHDGLRGLSEAAVHVWMNFDDDTFAEPVEKLFCKLLSHSTPSLCSCTLLSVFRRWPSPDVIGRCMFRLSEVNTYTSAFLSALVSADIILYGSQLMESIATDSDFMSKLDGGLLDAPLIQLVERDLVLSHRDTIQKVYHSLSNRLQMHQFEDFQASENAIRCLIHLAKNVELSVLDPYKPVLDSLQYYLAQNFELIAPISEKLRRWNRLYNTVLRPLSIIDGAMTFHSVQTLLQNAYGHAVDLLEHCLDDQCLEPHVVSDLHRLINGLSIIFTSSKGKWKNEASMINSAVRVAEICFLHLTDGDDYDFTLEDVALLVHELDQMARASPLSTDVLKHSMRQLFQTICRRSVLRRSFFESLTETASRRASNTLIILNICLSHLDKIHFKADMMEIFLSSFNASVETSDILMRSVINKYMTFATSECPLGIFSMRWNEVVNRNNTLGAWDWLPDAIDLQRINATVRDFPYQDQYIIEDTLLPKESGEGTGTGSTAKDNRYSPAFILGLVLSGLIETDDEVTFVYRLCEKGTVALALASLCANCHNIRQLAVAILGRLLRVLYSDRARAISWWSYRPQLALLIKSVHQALSIQKADKCWENGEVRRLPSLASIFLAKAGLILTKPGDRMFPAMNRYFLRVEEDHGAFQDVYRFPGFISFFCSTADELSQVSTERVWALQLLTDGFLDDQCYKPVLSCHGLELIMSSLERRTSDAFDEQETLLSLKALRKIVCFGGERCHDHLFRRLGLLDWLRSLIVSRPILRKMKNMQSRTAFVELLLEALRKSQIILSAEDAARGAVDVAQPLVEFCLSAENSDCQAFQNLLSSCCQSLHEIGSLCLTREADSQASDNFAGVNTRDAFTLLRAVSNDEQLQTLFSLCIVPVQLADSEDCALELSMALLRILASAKVERLVEIPSMTRFVLSRVLLLLSVSKLTSKDADSLVEKLCSLRLVCSTDCNLRETYFSLLTHIDQRAELSEPWLSIVGSKGSQL